MTKMNCDIEPGALYTYGLTENTSLFSAYDGRVRMRITIATGHRHCDSLSLVMRALKAKYELTHTYIGTDACVVWVHE